MVRRAAAVKVGLGVSTLSIRIPAWWHKRECDCPLKVVPELPRPRAVADSGLGVWQRDAVVARPHIVLGGGGSV